MRKTIITWVVISTFVYLGMLITSHAKPNKQEVAKQKIETIEQLREEAEKHGFKLWSNDVIEHQTAELEKKKQELVKYEAGQMQRIEQESAKRKAELDDWEKDKKTELETLKKQIDNQIIKIEQTLKEKKHKYWAEGYYEGWRSAAGKLKIR